MIPDIKTGSPTRHVLEKFDAGLDYCTFPVSILITQLYDKFII